MKFNKIVCLSFLLIAACNVPNGENQQEQLIIKKTQLDNKDSTLKSTSHELPIEKIETENLFANKLYFLTSDYDFETCEASAQCDCCSSELYFIDSYNYVYSNSCEGSQNFLKGTYEVASNKLILNHDSLYVYSQQPFGDEEDSVEYGIFKKNKKFNPTNAIIQSCGGQTLIHLKLDNYSEFGTEDNERTTLYEILQNPYSEIMQKLELK